MQKDQVCLQENEIAFLKAELLQVRGELGRLRETKEEENTQQQVQIQYVVISNRSKGFKIFNLNLISCS